MPNREYGLQCVQFSDLTPKSDSDAPDVIFLYVQAASPSKDTLGATNGISQTAASIARAIGPASATSLFALSTQRQDIAGGNLVYCVLIVLTVIATGVSRMLPAEPWQKPIDKE